MNIQISFSYEDREGNENTTESDAYHGFKDAHDFLEVMQEDYEKKEAMADLANQANEEE